VSKKINRRLNAWSTILKFSSYFLQKEYLFIFFNPWNTFPLYFIIFPHKNWTSLSILSLSLEKSQEDLFSCSLFFIKCYWNKNYIIFIFCFLSWNATYTLCLEKLCSYWGSNSHTWLH
jgi:hypothetical protein